jgi:phosphonatase-like hydrolase
MNVAAVLADMAGTTIEDDGLVMGAFADALDALGVDDERNRQHAMDYVVETMGRSKIDVFTDLFGERRASDANDAFEVAYLRRVDAGGVRLLDGVAELMARLGDRGIAVALTTGFSPVTRDAILDAVGWSSMVALSPVDVGRGRPFPDMIFGALERLGMDRTCSFCVTGDTASDMEAGRAARAALVVGVLTGFDDAERLTGAGADVVLERVAFIDELFAD